MVYIIQMHWLKTFLPVALVAFSLYAATTAPSIVTFFDDSLEFQFIAPTLGIAHPTGYPLYTLLGALWSRVLFPVGNWAWRMNLFSAVAAAAAVGLLFQLALKLLSFSLIDGPNQPSVANGSSPPGQASPGNPLVHIPPFGYLCAAVATTALAIVPVWWQQATVAEVYALHGLFVVAILLAAVNVATANTKTRLQGRPSWGWPNQGSWSSPFLATPWRGNFDFVSLSRCSVNVATANAATATVGHGSSAARVAPRAVFWLALLIGLSLTHHRLTILLLPGVTLYLFWTAPSIFRPQPAWISWALGLTIPLLLYFYLPMRAAMGAVDLNGSYQNTLWGFVSHVNASAYTTFFQWNSQSLQVFREQFSWWGLLWGAWGGAAAVLTPIFMRLTAPLHRNYHQPEWALIWMTFLTSLLFGLFYNVEDVAVFLIPAYICWTLFMGYGFRTLFLFFERNIANREIFQTVSSEQKHSVQSGPIQQRAAPALSLLCCGIIAFFIAASPLLYNNAVNRSQMWQAHDQAVALAKVDFPPESHVIGLEGEATAIKYMQKAEGLANTVTALWANDPDDRLTMVQQMMAKGSPLFLTREVAGIESQYSFTGEGPLIRIWPRGEVEPQEPQRRLDLLLLEGALSLEGVDVNVLQEAGGPRLQVVYYWHPNQQLSQRIKLSLRLLREGQIVTDENGQEMISDRFPLRQATYSEFWVPNEQVRDVHYISLSDVDYLVATKSPLAKLTGQGQDVATEAFELQSIVYDSNTVEELGRIPIPVQLPVWSR